MRAVLDHVGIAVERLEPAMQFFRDALGLHVEAPEEVPSQAVRAHFVPLEGLAALELLEATAPAVADRHVRREARARPAPHHAARRRHPRGIGASRPRAACGWWTRRRASAPAGR